MRRRRRASLLQVEKTSLPAKRSLMSRRSSMRLDASGGGSEGSFSSPTRTRHQTIELMREVQSGQKNQLLPSRMTMDVAASQLAQEMAPSYSRAFNNHSCCYRMLNGRSKSTQGRAFKFVVLVLIVVSCMNFLASTIPGIDDDPIWAEVIFAVEAVSSVFFLVEYILRMYIVPSEKRNLRGLGCLGGRLRFALTFDMLIDLISFLPFFIECAAKLCDQAFPMSKLTEKLSDLPQVCVLCLHFPRMHSLVLCSRAALASFLLLLLLLLLPHESSSGGSAQRAFSGCSKSKSTRARFVLS